MRTLVSHKFRPYVASLCVALMFVFVGASTATAVNRVQHASENTASHEHMLLSDISYLADHDDRLHADEHHDDVGSAKSEKSDVHDLIGGEHEDALGSHTGHHHHHQGEVGGSMVVLTSGVPSLLLTSDRGQRLVPDQMPPSTGHLLPERPPRALANHA